MNIYEYDKNEIKNEIITKIYEDQYILIERIVSSFHKTPKENPYNSNYLEQVILVKGQATLQIKTEIIELNEGDTYLINKNTPHLVLKTSIECIWICIYSKEKK